MRRFLVLSTLIVVVLVLLGAGAGFALAEDGPFNSDRKSVV